MLKPVKRSNLSNQVYSQLRDNILVSKYCPGERLPSERELCDALQVNRSSVREALKRLEQARLVEIRHGGGCEVLDFRVNGGFELLRHLIMPEGQVNGLVVRSILEFRALIGPEIARLAAQRIKEAELKHINDIVEQLEACRDDDLETIQDLDFDFHYTMAQAGENLALLLILNSTRDTYFKLRGDFSALFGRMAHTRPLYRLIYKALSDGAPKRAERHCARLIKAGNDNFWEQSGVEGPMVASPKTATPGRQSPKAASITSKKEIKR